MKGANGFGTFESLNEAIRIKRENQRNKERLEITLLQSQVNFQEINNQFVHKQSQLIDNQIATNKITRITNVIIAVFTGAAALWYIRDLCDKSISDCYANKNSWLLCITMSIGLLETIAILRIFQVQQQEVKKRNEPLDTSSHGK